MLQAIESERDRGGKGGGATRYLHLKEPLKMHRGGLLRQAGVAYECWGELNRVKDNAVLLFTGLSTSAHAASSRQDPSPGWWEYMVGPDKPIDSSRWFVICINSLGSCYGSTGPASNNPETGEPYRLSFPDLSIEDIAAAGHLVAGSLGIERLKAVAGVSLGGMSAMAYLMHYPDEVEHLISISSAVKATPHAIGIRSLQREIIRKDPAWQGGNYPLNEGPVEGMLLARKLGLISYRSAEEWDERFGRDMLSDGRRQSEPFGMEFQVESYLEANARKFIGSFDANAYLYLSRAMDWFDVEDHPERLIALQESSMGKKALVVGVETDTLFPLHQQRAKADLLSECNLEVAFQPLPSLQGHDAFLVDKERFAPVLRSFLDSL